MTGGGAPDPGDELVPGGIVALHRTAVLLTADADLALDLVASVLRRQPRPGPDRDVAGAMDRLLRQVVRTYLRTAPRRPDAPGREPGPGPDADAYDVLRTLRPRARAATVLRVAHGWDLDATATAVGLSPRRVTALLPAVPGLDRALDAIGEQHRLSHAEVMAAVGDRGTPSTASGSERRRRWLLVGAGAVVALAAWSALSGPDSGLDGPPDATGAVPPPDGLRGLDGTDLTEYGWRLDTQGKAPVVAMGLQRQTVVEVPYGTPTQEVTWDAGHLLPGGSAAYAVLWCDLPPTDPHIEQPSARLTTDAGTVDLPCAGRGDETPVRRVTPVPVTGPGQVELLGDLPREGGALLALYREGALSATLPLPEQVAGGPVPQVPAGAAVVDTLVLPRDWAGRTRLVSSVEVSDGTEVRVWAGRTGSVSVFVDGFPVTDDGDLASTGDPGWQGQQLDLRDGRWVVYLPGTARTFALPEQLRPPVGQTRTATVEVFTQGMDQDVQVVATQASAARPVADGADALPPGSPALTDLPLPAEGYRLAGAWAVPQDGLGHDLLPAAPSRPGADQEVRDGPALAPGTELVAFTGADLPARGPDRDEGWGLARHTSSGADVVTPLPLAPGGPDLDVWSVHRLDPWRVAQDLTVPAAAPVTPTPDTAPSRVWLPAVAGHPTATVLALEPVDGQSPSPPGR